MKTFIIPLYLFIHSCIPLLAQEPPWNTRIEIPHSTIKDQGRSASCWAYAAVSFLESEQLRISGIYTPLSPMFFVYNVYKDKAQTYLFRQGKSAFEGGGMAHDVFRNLEKNGAIPAEIYRGRPQGQTRNDHRNLHDSLKNHLDSYRENPDRFPQGWAPEFNRILDQHMGQISNSFDFQNQCFTPCDFFKELNLNPEDYATLTSFLHVPLYQNFVLDVPYNFSNGSLYNVPLDRLMFALEEGLQHGYSALVELDATHPYFLYQKGEGIALVPEGTPGIETVLSVSIPEQTISPQERQFAFETLATQQDHTMHIVGLVADAQGKKFFKAKNSWSSTGPNSGQKGYIYLSEAYLRLNLISATLHRKWVPKTR